MKYCFVPNPCGTYVKNGVRGNVASGPRLISPHPITEAESLLDYIQGNGITIYVAPPTLKSQRKLTIIKRLQAINANLIEDFYNFLNTRPDIAIYWHEAIEIDPAEPEFGLLAPLVRDALQLTQEQFNSLFT